MIRRTVREADIVVRYGGDEFLILLPTTHFAGSVAVAERIWREVGARPWGPFADGERMTLSIGIALYPSRDVRGKEALVKAAETALHRAKRDGMNRICVFQQEGSFTRRPPARFPPAPAPATVGVARDRYCLAALGGAAAAS